MAHIRRPPTRTWFLQRLHSLFPMDVAGHSLRSGGATYFAAAGWPDDRIQALGRWSSDAFKIYARKNPVFLKALLHGRTIAALTTFTSGPPHHASSVTGYGFGPCASVFVYTLEKCTSRRPSKWEGRIHAISFVCATFGQVRS